MGDGGSPGTDSRHGDGGQPVDRLAEYDRLGFGVGRRDPVTGIYEVYDVPEWYKAKRRHEAAASEGGGIPWAEIFAQWGLLVADFASEYRIRLTTDIRCMTWREFKQLTRGLLAAETRLSRYFTLPPDVDDPATAPEEVSDDG